MKNLYGKSLGTIIWGAIIFFVIIDNQYDCNGSDDWGPVKREWDDEMPDGDWDNDGRYNTEADYDYWKNQMFDDDKREILYGDD